MVMNANVKTEGSSNRSQVFEVAGAWVLQHQNTHSRSITRHATSFSSAIILADLTSSLQMKERSQLLPLLETKSLFCEGAYDFTWIHSHQLNHPKTAVFSNTVVLYIQPFTNCFEMCPIKVMSTKDSGKAIVQGAWKNHQLWCGISVCVLSQTEYNNSPPSKNNY